MDHNTGWTPSPDENLLGLTDKALINQYEAKGIANAELLIFQLDSEVVISTSLILTIHKVAFEELYDWAGKWRITNVTVGQLVPPTPIQVPQLILQFIDNLNFKISIASTADAHVDCLVYAHYEFIRIHPFNNGNGRTGRL
jgi:cell filamentation protein